MGRQQYPRANAMFALLSLSLDRLLGAQRAFFRSVRCVLSGVAVVRRHRNRRCDRRSRRLCQHRRCQYIALSARSLHRDRRDHSSFGLARRLRTLKMETAGKTRTTPRGRLISIAIVALAVALGFMHSAKATFTRLRATVRSMPMWSTSPPPWAAALLSFPSSKICASPRVAFFSRSIRYPIA